MTRPPIAPALPILVIDDSAVARQAIKALVEADPGFHVLTASDPYDAVEVMRRTVPSAIVLDVNMPRMDGLTFLRKLMRQHPLPVLLCTEQPERGLAGLELGALEVIPKPGWDRPDAVAAWGEQLRASLRLAIATLRGSREAALLAPSRPPSAEIPTSLATSPRSPSASPRPPSAVDLPTTVQRPPSSGELPTTVQRPPSSGELPTTAQRPTVEPRHSADAILPRSKGPPRTLPADRLIVIGASTGGVQAIARLLPGFSPDAPGIVVVQHMPGGFTAAFADRLHRDPHLRLEVVEARHGEPIRSGTVLVVPGDVHGLVRRSGPGCRLDLVDGPPVNRHRPSVDVLFRSAAQAAGARCLGILLTGMGDDGAQGLLELSEAGGWTIAQDESTCVVFGMPREAIRRGAARQVLALDRIAAAAQGWASG